MLFVIFLSYLNFFDIFVFIVLFVFAPTHIFMLKCVKLLPFMSCVLCFYFVFMGFLKLNFSVTCFQSFFFFFLFTALSNKEGSLTGPDIFTHRMMEHTDYQDGGVKQIPDCRKQ